ncbi:MAG TPA: hypothetical protein VHD56_09915 [Tepidisphaeraceae bacterium]|nr:hypothetical protein [Tepidisphaeraceae bacterium]
MEKLGAGVGQDGTVWRTAQHTAVKFFDRSERFERERDVYQLLTRRQILRVASHNVPELILFDDELRVIEMTIVTRPFILDFAGAKLPHEIPDFDADVIEEHHRHLEELFGERWTDALHVAEMFRLETGYTLLDIHPGNIAFAGE